MPSSIAGGVLSVLDDDRIKGAAAFFAAMGKGFDGSWASLLGGTPVQTNTEAPMYSDLGSVPQMKEWKGDAEFMELATYRGGLRNLDYLSGLLVKKTDVRRDKTGQIRERLGQLGQRAATYWETMISDLLKVSETDGSGTINSVPDLSVQAYDGQAFFDTDHAFTAGYTTAQTNDIATGDYSNLGAVSTATAPTVAEAAAFMPDILGHFWTLKDDQGEPANGNAKNFLVMVGTNALFAPISAALGLQTISTGVQSASFGMVQSLGLTVRVVLNPRLSANTTKIYAFCLDSSEGPPPFLLQEEVPIQIAEDQGLPWQPDIRVACWGTRRAGFRNWMRAVLATLS